MDVTLGMTVKQRIIALLICTTLLLGGLLWGALSALGSQLDDMNELYTERVEPLQQLKQVSDDFARLIVETAYDREAGGITWEAALGRIRQGIEEIEPTWSFYAAGDLGEREMALVDRIEPALDYAIEQMLVLETIMASQDADALRAFVADDLAPMATPVSNGLRELSSLQLTLAGETYARAESNYVTISLIMVGVIVVALAMLIVGVIVLLKGIVTPLKTAERYASDIANGDLFTTMPLVGNDEFTSMTRALNEMSDDLAKVVDDVTEVASTMTHGVREIAAGNLNLSERTEEQAASLEETAASMEQMTATVKQNADNAKTANDLAADATSQAERGVDIAGVALTAMDEINDASRKISEITGVVDEIAFQTNLLALNAAVEAARAGEAGRGFAVVASEVRVLAQRSAEAAKQIKTLIEDSVAKVDSGSGYVQQSADALGDIVTAVKQVSTIMGEIRASSVEQSDGIEQVNDAIMQMDQMTQQNAALVEQAAAAARDLESEAGQLDQRVAFFQTRRSLEQGVKTVAPDTTAEESAPPVTRPARIAHTSDDGNWQQF